MKEINFLKQNARRWEQAEEFLKNRKNRNPDELAGYFIELTDDLSYSKTFYPGTATTRYLNELAGRFYHLIYRNKKERRGRIISFWKHDLPEEIRRSRRHLAYALLVFVAAMFIGAISSANDNTFVRLIMGDHYVNMTLENIEKGDPMAVYKKMNETDMFLGITLNNIRAAFAAFTLGVVFSAGSFYVLFTNGVMLGAFQHFFYEEGLFIDSVLSIWIHGVLEISAIIIAGGAGIMIGASLIFPGTYSRRQSFMNSVRRGIRIITGIVPMFIVAGFLEGFVTRHTEMHAGIRAGIIIASLLFVIWYFIIYPLRLGKEIEG
ncbi:MAG: stage II sporulation protein M [Spirochaetes bacterium]|nr:stage II sporulation protein M [Spirochaetota bacterium]